nr:serine/threonine-protein kinase EDR1-like isoform X1 [Ipomoea batatas]
MWELCTLSRPWEGVPPEGVYAVAKRGIRGWKIPEGEPLGRLIAESNSLVVQLALSKITKMLEYKKYDFVMQRQLSFGTLTLLLQKRLRESLSSQYSYHSPGVGNNLLSVAHLLGLGYEKELQEVYALFHEEKAS